MTIPSIFNCLQPQTIVRDANSDSNTFNLDIFISSCQLGVNVAVKIREAAEDDFHLCALCG